MFVWAGCVRIGLRVGEGSCGWSQVNAAYEYMHSCVSVAFQRQFFFFITAGYSLLCVWMDAHHKGNMSAHLGFFSSHLSPALKKRITWLLVHKFLLQSTESCYFPLKINATPFSLVIYRKATPSNRLCPTLISTLHNVLTCLMLYTVTGLLQVVICLTCFEAYSAY